MTSISYCFNDAGGIKLPDEFLEGCLTEQAYCVQIPDEDGLFCLEISKDISQFSSEERMNGKEVVIINRRLQIPPQFREKLNDCVVIVFFENRLEIWPQDDWMAASERKDDIDLEELLKELGL